MFSSRQEAGKLLAGQLPELSLGKTVVLGITRGGVVVAWEVAKALSAPLFPLVIAKIGAPWNPEFALGAMAPDGKIVGSIFEISRQQIKKVRQKIRKRLKEYGVKTSKLEKTLKDKTAIIVDDGMATGLTMEAAIEYVKSKRPEKIIAAIPVADKQVEERVKHQIDNLIVLQSVDNLGAVGNFYDDFSPVSDEEVISTLKNFSHRPR